MWTGLAHRASWLAFVLLAPAAGFAAAPPDNAVDVPVKQVVLFSSGVGYFEHFGTVKGDGHTELRFQTEQINDVLKSLVLQDLDGGRAGTVTYPSQEPIDRTLKSFQVDITTNPGLEDMLNQLRGAALSVTAGGEAVKGTIVGVQKRQMPATEKVPAHETWWLNLKAGRTIRSIAMADVSDFALEDPKLDAELDRALAALAQSRDQEKKPVTINFRGEGERRVRLGYVVETPVWKTSYRLILDRNEDAKARKPDAAKLQGWAIVENQTDSDWTDVQLSLVSGRPISFIQQLYRPLYVPRPVVWPELYASLRPQTYRGGITAEEFDQLRRREIRDEQVQAEGDEAPTFSLDQAAGRRGGRGGGGGGGLFGAGGEESEAMDPVSSVAAMASAGQLGELFQYTIGNVSLPRQRSAMIPIVTDAIEAQKVSIFNPQVLGDHPLNGARVKNTTGKHLLQGPVTVLDAGAYAGDARIDDIPPGQQRLLSYGVDLQVLVSTEHEQTRSTIQSGRIAKGVLEVFRKEVHARTYVAQNKSDAARTIVFESPVEDGNAKLVEPKTFDEETPDLYRFTRTVPAGQGVRLRVVTESPNVQGVQIGKPEEDLAVYVQAETIPEAVRKALGDLIARRREIADVSTQLAERQARVNATSEEQKRIRENMKTVAQNSEYYQRLLKKLDEQETSLETLQGEIDARQKKLAGLNAALAKDVAELNIDVD